MRVLQEVTTARKSLAKVRALMLDRQTPGPEASAHYDLIISWVRKYGDARAREKSQRERAYRLSARSIP